jgi:hypothetical protein
MRYGVDALPHACAMYVTKKLGVCWGLVDKISPAFELRNSGVSAVARPFQLPASALRRPIKSASISSQAGHRVPLAYAPLCCSSWAVSGLYLPKAASSPAGLVALGIFVHPSNQSGAGAAKRTAGGY